MSPQISKNPRSEPLSAKVKDGKLIIEIGIATLSSLFESSDLNRIFDEEKQDFYSEWKVSNSELFAADVLASIVKEDETGGNAITDLLDYGMEQAVAFSEAITEQNNV